LPDRAAHRLLSPALANEAIGSVAAFLTFFDHNPASAFV
jgi:hypothetical protein